MTRRPQHPEDIGRRRVKNAAIAYAKMKTPGTGHVMKTFGEEDPAPTVQWSERIVCPTLGCGARLAVKKLARPYRCPACRHVLAPCHVCDKSGKASCPLKHGRPCLHDSERYEAVQVIYERGSAK